MYKEESDSEPEIEESQYATGEEKILKKKKTVKQSPPKKKKKLTSFKFY